MNKGIEVVMKFMKKEEDKEPEERERIQRKLFECQCCNIENQFECKIRNEDILGSMNAEIWVVGLNPHCTNEEKEYFHKKFHSEEKEKEEFFEYWKKRAMNYFNETDKFLGAGFDSEETRKKVELYQYFKTINYDFPNLKLGENCSHVDFYKIGTTDERELKESIKKSMGNVEKCPERFFLEQIRMQKPKLLILTGNVVKDWFTRRYKTELNQNDLDDLKKGITKVPIKIYNWRKRTGEEYNLLFCPSFSGSARGAWGKKDSEKRRDFNNKIVEIISTFY